MAGEWKTHKIFISSTFRDMGAERDLLVKKVFPNLRQRLLRHRRWLFEVDLRWGITLEQSENAQTLGLCLDRIDACRPLFLGLLGGCYGTVLDDRPANMPSLKQTVEKHSWLKDVDKGTSLTELEIQYGAFGKAHEGGSSPLLFFRQDISGLPTALQPVFTEEGDDARKKLTALKEKLRGEMGPGVIIDYPARFQGIRFPQGISLPLQESLRTFPFIAAPLGDALSAEELSQLPIDIQELLCTPPFECQLDLNEYENLVKEALWTRLKEVLALSPDEDLPVLVPNLADQEGIHEQFMESRLLEYVVPSKISKALQKRLLSPQGSMTMVSGPPGCGKSALLA